MFDLIEKTLLMITFCVFVTLVNVWMIKALLSLVVDLFT